ncbi:MAG: replication initiator protein A [Oscillospiraceae bacterium]|nr:replication initiator protein A [Oscillospiraceae bacterium]
MALDLNYYYGNEADQYSFYRIPKTLLTDPRYKGVTIEAKVLYGLLLDRMGLSIRNGWTDNSGRVYIYFTLEDTMQMMDCGHTKAVKLFADLEQSGLIERRRQGQGKPARIYVKNFILPSQDNPADAEPEPEPEDFQTSGFGKSKPLASTSMDAQTPVDENNVEPSHPVSDKMQTSDFGKSELPVSASVNTQTSDGERSALLLSVPAKAQTSDNGKSGASIFAPVETQTSEKRKLGLPQNSSLDFRKINANKTDKKNTELSDTDLSPYLSAPTPPVYAPTGKSRQGMRTDEMEEYRELIKENIEFDRLAENHPYDVETLEGYVEMMAEVCCSRKEYIHISGENRAAGIVKSQFLKLNRDHIGYVLECMNNTTTRIKNIRAYTLAALYNAPNTMSQYYASRVSYDMHDMAESC